MATNIPPHNLGEVIDAAVHVLDHPDATPDDLMQFVTGPDFPTGATILGRDGIQDAYRTGSRLDPTARARRDRRGPPRRAAHRRHRDPVPDVGRGHRAEDRRARQRAQDRGHPRRPQRVVGCHEPPRHRAEARRQRPGRAEPALQAHADADELPRAHARARRRRPAAAQPGPGGQGLRRAPDRGRHPADAVPAEARPRTAPTSSRASSAPST